MTTERVPEGLIDTLLAIRQVPGPETLLRLTQPREDLLDEHEAILGFRAGLDAALDLVVPALKQIVMLPADKGPNAISKAEVERIIGRIPLNRNERGWRV